MDFDISLPDPSATLELGKALSRGLAPGVVVYLRGELGAGKTTLVRGVLRGLGYQGRVKSPTYALVEPYSFSRLHLYHFDFYRFTDRAEWLSSGFRDYFNAQSACLVEWPERVEGLLPSPDLDVRLHFAERGRRATLRARSPAGETWLSSLPFS